MTGRTFAWDAIRARPAPSGRAAARLRPLGAGVDPRLEQGDLRGARARLTLGRHRRLRHARELADHPAAGGVAGGAAGPCGVPLQRGVAFERELALALVVVVAAGAILREDRRDLRRVVRSAASAQAAAVQASRTASAAAESNWRVMRSPQGEELDAASNAVPAHPQR